MYSAENWIHDCDEDELWDPFSEVFPISYYLIFQINYYLIDLLGQLSMWIWLFFTCPYVRPSRVLKSSNATTVGLAECIIVVFNLLLYILGLPSDLLRL